MTWRKRDSTRRRRIPKEIEGKEEIEGRDKDFEGRDKDIEGRKEEIEGKEKEKFAEGIQ